MECAALDISSASGGVQLKAVVQVSGCSKGGYCKRVGVGWITTEGLGRLLTLMHALLLHATLPLTQVSETAGTTLTTHKGGLGWQEQASAFTMQLKEKTLPCPLS